MEKLSPEEIVPIVRQEYRRLCRFQATRLNRFRCEAGWDCAELDRQTAQMLGIDFWRRMEKKKWKYYSLHAVIFAAALFNKRVSIQFYDAPPRPNAASLIRPSMASLMNWRD